MKKKLLITVGIVVVFVVIGWLYIIGIQKPINTPSPPTDSTKFSMTIVAMHNTKNDCWTIIAGNVYDISAYINRHPGGQEITRACGQDATTLFTERKTSDGAVIGSGSPHSGAARAQLETLKIGELSTP